VVDQPRFRAVEPITPTYVGDRLLPLHERLSALLRGLSSEDWLRPTVAGAWRVRDIAAHLVDGSLRTVSSRRDAYRPRGGPVLRTYQDVVAYINVINREWVEASERLSPPLLIELLDRYGPLEAQLLAALPPHDRSPISVLWAGEMESENWMHVGREYTERWHHQLQIRDAVQGSSPTLIADLLTYEWCYPALDLSVRALPHAYREVEASDGSALLISVAGTGPAPWSADWTLRREDGRWSVWRGRTPIVSATVVADADTMWRLLYNALPANAARERMAVDGESSLAEPLFETRSVMV